MSNDMGGYHLLEQIGHGASGRVWRARRSSSGDLVAIKVLRSELADDTEARARFLREGELLANRVLPGTVRVHETVSDAERVGLVMDLVEGPDLRQFMAAVGPLPAGRTCALLGQVATALAAAHATGLVHRDVKPENVLIVEERQGPGTALLSDFGLASVLEDTTRGRTQSQAMGTPHYVAPEVLRGQRAQAPADVYALGVVFFEMLVGWRPFRAAHPAALMQQHLEDQPVRPDSVPGAAWDVIEGCLAKDPALRPTAEALAAELRALASTLAETLPAPHTDPPTEQELTVLRGGTRRVGAEEERTDDVPDQPARRRRWVWGAAAAAVALVVGTAWIAGAASGPDPVRKDALLLADASPSSASEDGSTASSPAGSTSSTEEPSPSVPPTTEVPVPSTTPTSAGGAGVPPNVDTAPPEVPSQGANVPTQAPAPGDLPSTTDDRTPDGPPAVEEDPPQPITLDPETDPRRAGGNCAGSVVTNGKHSYTVGGRVVAVTTIYYDGATGRNCALFTKSVDRGVTSYLALTLCNDSGECDRDRNYYPSEAGPVSVYGKGSCVTFTVSALTPDKTSWLLPEESMKDHCG